jgi:hypothetical protein
LSPLSQDSQFRFEIESELRYHPPIGNQLSFPTGACHAPRGARSGYGDLFVKLGAAVPGGDD